MLAEAMRPATTGTKAGALPTTSPMRFSVVTMYSPGSRRVSKTPFLPEEARCTAPDCDAFGAVRFTVEVVR